MIFALYSLLCISLFLGKEYRFFGYLSSIILLLPVLFYSLNSFGFLKVRGFIYGMLSSAVYLPFINLSAADFNLLPQSISEEIFFRGYMQNELSKKLEVHRSILLTSVFFTIPHIITDFSVFSFLVIFPSILFGYLYYYSGSVWAPSIFHFFSNLFFWQYLKPLLS
ncbi:CPBP family glutamic-type intramembrane protease [Persephonella sp.]